MIGGEKVGKLLFKAKGGFENKSCKQYFKSEYPKSQAKTKDTMIPSTAMMFNLWSIFNCTLRLLLNARLMLGMFPYESLLGKGMGNPMMVTN